jgi:hypothetical protein
MGFVQSLVLAALAEYVAVIFDEVKGRPLGLVRSEWRGGARVEPGQGASPPSAAERSASDSR